MASDRQSKPGECFVDKLQTPESADKSIERLPEYLWKYSEKKTSVTRFAGTFALLCLVVAFAARTPTIRVDAETFGLLKGELHSEYLLVYGEPLSSLPP